MRGYHRLGHPRFPFLLFCRGCSISHAISVGHFRSKHWENLPIVLRLGSVGQPGDESSSFILQRDASTGGMLVIERSEHAGPQKQWSKPNHIIHRLPISRNELNVMPPCPEASPGWSCKTSCQWVGWTLSQSMHPYQSAPQSMQLLDSYNGDIL